MEAHKQNVQQYTREMHGILVTIRGLIDLSQMDPEDTGIPVYLDLMQKQALQLDRMIRRLHTDAVALTKEHRA